MKKILIADDDPVMTRLLEFHLRRANYATITCREGLSVVKRALEEHPDLAVIDLMLPGRSGKELIEEFRANEKLEDLPVIVVTGQGRESTHDALSRAGARHVFTKPFSPTALIGRINTILGQK